MTHDQKQRLKSLIATINLYYGRQPLLDAVILMQVSDMEDLEFDDVTRAFDSYRKNPKNRVPPLPADIRNLIQPAQTDEQLAIDSASRIVQAITKYGYTNPDRAKRFIGELGWEIVRREGGWENLCERLRDHEIGMFKAQTRELAKSLISRSRAGLLEQPPALPEPENKTKSLASGPSDLRSLLPRIEKQEK